MYLRVIAWVAAASLALTISSRAGAQELPDALKARALSVHIDAFVMSPSASSSAPAPASPSPPAAGAAPPAGTPPAAGTPPTAAPQTATPPTAAPQPAAASPAVTAQTGTSSTGAVVSWHQGSTGVTVPGTPVGVKLVASNVVILVQVTPFDRDEGHLTLVVQGQVWVRNDEGGLSFRTSVDKVEVGYGETIFFYPLGSVPSGKPLLRVAITVDKGAKGGASPQGQPARTETRSK